MNNLIIEKTQQTPEISFQTNGELSIKGISTPHNVQKFYQPLFDWLREYKDSEPANVNLVLEMEYLNTSSSRMFVELLLIVNSLKTQDTSVKITWRYEEDDEDILDLGEDLRLSSKSEFDFVMIL